MWGEQGEHVQVKMNKVNIWGQCEQGKHVEVRVNKVKLHTRQGKGNKEGYVKSLDETSTQ